MSPLKKSEPRSCIVSARGIDYIHKGNKPHGGKEYIMKVFEYIGDALGMFFLGTNFGTAVGIIGTIALFGFGFPALAGTFN